MSEQSIVFPDDLEPIQNNVTDVTAANDFDLLADLTISTLSESSRRSYAQIYARWFEWCETKGRDPIHALHMNSVESFLLSLDVTRATRRRYLSALRKSAEILALVSGIPEHKVAYEVMKKMKPPVQGASDSERQKVALTPGECQRAINAWNSFDPREIRNRAIVATLLLTGIRRAEAAALKWSDLDLHAGVANIRHGKGDKQREAAIYGDSAIDALDAWREIQGGQREYVFCSVNKGGNLGPDQPIDESSIYRVVKETEKRAGLRHFSPHDARRTLATELLETNTHVRDVQEQLGHADASTTMKYTQTTDARRRREKGQLRYD